MKYLITNKQFNLLMESNEDKILMLPNPERLGGWHILQQLLEKAGNPRYGIRGDLDLRGSSVESLGNLERVEGDLDLYDTSIKSLGNLKYVGGYLNLMSTPLSEITTEEEIRSKINVFGDIYF